MTAIGVSFPAAIDMNSSVIQGCFPNGFRQPVPLRPGPMPPPVAQRATMQRGAVFPPVRPVVPQRQQNQPVIQRFGAGTAMRLPDAMASAANRSIGQPLQPAVRQMMESLFRTSFADVRVHVGPHVSAIGATSYTQGSNIHFAPGQYDPEHGPGRQRLAYELAHVVQQKSGRVRNPFVGGVAVVHDAGLEAEAQRFARGAAMAPHQPRPAQRPIQRIAARRGGVIQPMVIRISVDDETASTYRNLTIIPSGYSDTTGSLRPVNASLDRLPLDGLRPDETLHIIVHGDGRGRVEGMDAAGLLAYLVRRGLDPNYHHGTIRLVSCYSATPILEGTTFVQEFVAVLRRNGFVNAAIGFDGLVRAGRDGGILVVSKENQERFYELKREREKLKFEFEGLVESSGFYKQDEILREMFLKDLSDFKVRMAKVQDEQESLWERQSLGKNLLHIAEAIIDHSHGDDDWHRRQRATLEGFNMIRPGGSVKPVRDYSLSYIS
jgi:hypothetical protein